MENQVCNCEHKNHNWVWWLILLLVASIITGLAVHYCEHHQEQFVEEDPELLNDSEITIKDVLDTRNYLLEAQHIDSVFLHMPEVVLIDILMTHGTSLSNAEIVDIYESYPETYNSVLSGARAQKYLTDSLTLKPQPEQYDTTIIHRMDSLKHVIDSLNKFKVKE